MAIKHNKKKNTSIVYEQLMIVMANLLAENKHEEFELVKNLVLKHFNKHSNLFREKRIFDSLISFKNEDLRVAEKFLDECLVESSLISPSELENEKVSLINEIINKLGFEIFNIPVKSYKLRASAQFMLNEMRNNLKYSSPEERLKLKLYLVENIKKQEKINKPIEKIDNLTMKILKDKYIKKYSSILNENQQKILVKWNEFLATQRKDELICFLNEEYKNIYKNLDFYIKKNLQNSNIDLLKEAREQTKNVKLVDANEKNIYETMRYWDIIEDLTTESNANV